MVPVFDNGSPAKQSKKSKHGSVGACLGPHLCLPRLRRSWKDPEFRILFFLVVTMFASGALLC
jgi:hypothetical protein